LQPDLSWDVDIGPVVKAFLLERVQTARRVRLSLDAHLTIAILCGSTLHHKSGVQTFVTQHGRTGEEVWHDGDGDNDQGEEISFSKKVLGSGKELAVAISLTRSTVEGVSEHALSENKNIGSILHCHMTVSPGQSSVKGGTHAARLADMIINEITMCLRNGYSNPVHLFISAPNAFAFFLGQHLAAIGSRLIYEFDFESSKKYYCSLKI